MGGIIVAELSANEGEMDSIEGWMHGQGSEMRVMDASKRRCMESRQFRERGDRSTKKGEYDGKR